MGEGPSHTLVYLLRAADISPSLLAAHARLTVPSAGTSTSRSTGAKSRGLDCDRVLARRDAKLLGLSPAQQTLVGVIDEKVKPHVPIDLPGKAGHADQAFGTHPHILSGPSRPA